MKRGTLLLAAAATAVAALAVSPVPAAGTTPHPTCVPVTAGTVLHTPRVGVGNLTIVPNNYHGFLWCGYRWQTLPIHFRVETADAPPQVTAGFIAAARAAAAAWNANWPGNRTTSTDCKSASLLCYDSAATSVVVKFGPVPDERVGRTYACSPGLPNCPTPPSGATSKTIYSATVILNTQLPSGETWKHASVAEAAVWGESPGLTGESCLVCDKWHDVQNVLTHEFGHVIGLEDVGETCTDLLEVVDYSQTMYPCFETGDTSKRTLSWGDQLGLVRMFEG